MDKIIIHVDMDAFYAAVEMRDDPSLKGKPLIIGGSPDSRGVVATCNYEARKYGIHSAMNVKEAYRRCPHGIFMYPDIAKYRAVSDKIHAIWNTYTKKIEYMSLDEGYLDITDSMTDAQTPFDIARSIKERTKTELGLTCSVGIGYSMMSAKLASEEKKPDGLYAILSREELINLIIDRPADTIYGVGKQTANRLAELGIHTVRDIYIHEERILSSFKSHGKSIVRLAKGIDEREVMPYYESEAKSIGTEHTFEKDISDMAYLETEFLAMAKKLSLKIKRRNKFAKTVTIKITFADMQTITRSKTAEGISDADKIYERVKSLFDIVEKDREIRLIGISLSGLEDVRYKQLHLEEML